MDRCPEQIESIFQPIHHDSIHQVAGADMAVLSRCVRRSQPAMGRLGGEFILDVVARTVELEFNGRYTEISTENHTF
jgi:hypothetical protein